MPVRGDQKAALHLATHLRKGKKLVRARHLVAVLVPLLIAGACSATGPVVHKDDEAHPLSLTYGGSGSLTVHPPEERAEGDVWAGTVGAFLPCVNEGMGPVRITEIEWGSDAGLEPESVETFLRNFDSTTTDPFLSMLGTPQDPLDEDFEGNVQTDAVGYVASTPCDDIGGPDGFRGQMDEILLALSAGDAGGHIGQLRFHYEADNRSYILEIDWDFYLCGSAVPEEFECP